MTYLRKYGRNKVTPVTEGDIRLYGKQILTTLKLLHDKGFAYGKYTTLTDLSVGIRRMYQYIQTIAIFSVNVEYLEMVGILK